MSPNRHTHSFLARLQRTHVVQIAHCALCCAANSSAALSAAAIDGARRFAIGARSRSSSHSPKLWAFFSSLALLESARFLATNCWGNMSPTSPPHCLPPLRPRCVQLEVRRGRDRHTRTARGCHWVPACDSQLAPTMQKTPFPNQGAGMRVESFCTPSNLGRTLGDVNVINIARASSVGIAIVTPHPFLGGLGT